MTMTTDGRSALPAGNVTTLPAARTGRNMMSIASGKGGVGKTWFAITLSQALARLGRRILLFDGDLGLANVDIQLGLMPSRDLASVLDGAVTLKGAAQHYDAGGFDVVAGRSGSGSLAGLSQQRMADLREELLGLAAAYDRVEIGRPACRERGCQYVLIRVVHSSL